MSPTGLDVDDIAASRWALGAEIRRRQLAGHPIPRWLARAHRRVTVAAETATSHDPSATGHRGGSAAPRSVVGDDCLIGAAAAAEILKLSQRHAVRLAADLEGQQVGGVWIFNKAIVTAYAQARTEHHGDT